MDDLIKDIHDYCFYAAATAGAIVNKLLGKYAENDILNAIDQMVANSQLEVVHDGDETYYRA